MALPAFNYSPFGCLNKNPKILILEVKQRTDPNGIVVAYVFVEREENIRWENNCNDINKIGRATIKLHYQYHDMKSGVKHSQCQSFHGCYERMASGEQRVSITSNMMDSGAVFLDPPNAQGNRIGTYLMNQIVLWVKNWPEAHLIKISLEENQATNDESKTRRNNFYDRFGVKFEFHDDDQKTGTSKPMIASDLKCVDTWRENISEISLSDYIPKQGEKYVQLQNANIDLNHSINAVKKEICDIRKKPLRWALQQTCWRAYSFFILFLILLLFVAISFGIWQDIQKYIIFVKEFFR